MRTGKISESILKRSVLRQIGNHKEEVIKGAGIGEDCAFLSWNSSLSGQAAGEGAIAVSTQAFTLPVKNSAYLAVMAAANNLAASGAVPKAVFLSLVLPREAEEGLLKELMEQAEKCSREWNIQIAGGHTEVSGAVGIPVITATVLGAALEAEPFTKIPFAGKTEDPLNGKPDNMDIVVSKWIGLEGTFIIAGEKAEELSRRYPPGIILGAKESGGYLSVASEAAIALKSGVYTMHDIRNGGIFGALWEVSRKIGVGLCVDLKKIPLRQETIEVCEFFDLNPYQLLSGGALLMAAADGRGLVKALEEEKIPACVIGSTNGTNDKIVVNQEEIRYLEPPAPDEIYKLFKEDLK
ncbi:MAG: hydrogenase maturation factor [Lachnospiraceae bacterium]|nr:hydrogenase maturation factor [Lachnospiraceae bacterium]